VHLATPKKAVGLLTFWNTDICNDGNYKSGNKGFARRAKMKQSAGVGNEFKRLMRSFLNKQVKAARI
jgi:hypothetical protein